MLREKEGQQCSPKPVKAGCGYHGEKREGALGSTDPSDLFPPFPAFGAGGLPSSLAPRGNHFLGIPLVRAPGL